MRVTHCRACTARDLELFLDLGVTALANSFVRPERASEPEPTFPLRAVVCRSCGLVQIDEEVPPETLYRHYLYVSGTSDLIHTHARRLADELAATGPLRPGDLVMEAASNDGTLLRAFQKKGLRVVGIEPAENIAALAAERGAPTVCAFFNAETARAVRTRYGPAKLILARHVLAHVADLHGFIAGLEHVIEPDGRVVIECPHLLPFHDHLEYDTIYHEHLCYFSVRVLAGLFARFGLEVIDVRAATIHGGSIVVTAQRAGGPRRASPSVAEVVAREEASGLHRTEVWHAFASRVAASRALLREEVERLRAGGKRLAGYGAPAKGMTLLAYCGLGPAEVPFLVDRSPLKQGLLTPGHRVPIDHPDRLARERPDVALLLAWNFAEEIVHQQAEYLRGGGRFLLPLPAPHYRGGPERRAA